MAPSQEAQDAKLILALSEAFNKDEAWQLDAAEAFSKATSTERVLIRGVGTASKQLKLVDALIRKTSAAGLDVEHAAGGAATQSTAPLLNPHGDGSLLWLLFGHFAEAAHQHHRGRQEHVRGALQAVSRQHQD